ncbi:MAG: lipocalin family protein [Pseudomonadota bacterium]|nr:lipocalin family protein [Pseudomonadota bacterium]
MPSSKSQQQLPKSQFKHFFKPLSTTFRHMGFAFMSLITIATVSGCSSLGVQGQSPFNVQNYMGTWYEIARLDHSFERGLTHVTAEYALMDSGEVSVLNRGFNPETGEFQEANGKAYLNKADHVGSLRVSFFWPFYGDYKVVDTDYTQYAIVSGNDLDYLWLLAREPEVSDEVIATFEDKASTLGYNINELIYVEQTPRGATP